MQLDHMNICAPAALLEQVLAFYCEVLGFEVGPRPDFGIPGYWLYTPGVERASVHLLESDNHQRAERPHLDHIAFNVPSLTDIRSQLDGRSVPYGHMEFSDFGIEQISFLDPAGVKVELNCYHS
jgi:catechol 2,3-dioxygenase-like lactoylglutathione lyase family enzyme